MKKIDINSLEELYANIKNLTDNDIAGKIVELNELKNSFVWEGPGHNAFINEYNKKMKTLVSMNNDLIKLGNFLNSAKEGYEETNNELNTEWKELLDELEVGDTDGM